MTSLPDDLTERPGGGTRGDGLGAAGPFTVFIESTGVTGATGPAGEPAPDSAHALVRKLLDAYFPPPTGPGPGNLAFAPKKGYTEAGRAELVDVIVREIGALLARGG